MLKEEFGLKCDTVENGFDELKAVIANSEKTCCDVRYRLILTDLNMPIMDGFDAAKNILGFWVSNGL